MYLFKSDFLILGFKSVFERSAKEIYLNYDGEKIEQRESGLEFVSEIDLGSLISHPKIRTFSDLGIP